jgi:hypothetical protein
MHQIFSIKLQSYQELSDYFMRLGNTGVIATKGNALVTEGKASRNVFGLKNTT